MRLQNNLAKDSRMAKTLKGSEEQMYHTVESPMKKSLGRNCVSLENLGIFITEDAFSGNFPGYPAPPVYPAFYYCNNPYQQPHQMCMSYHNSYLADHNNTYLNSIGSLGNSKQSIDDFRKYRDVAL